MTEPAVPRMRCSVPYNGDPSIPDLLVDASLIDHVAEIYFAGNPTQIPSGRRPKIGHYIRRSGARHFFDSAAYDQDLHRLIRFSRGVGIRCNLLLNFSGALTPNMLKYVTRVVDAGANAVTVGSADMIAQVKDKYGTNVAIENSVYVGAKEQRDIHSLLDLGVSILLVPPEMNHDFAALTAAHTSVKHYGAEMKLMVNEGCIKHCPHRQEDQQSAQEYGVTAAMFDYLYNPGEIRVLTEPCRAYLNKSGIAKTNYIHPNDIRKYNRFDPTLKIVGRSFSSETIIAACQAYVHGTHDGDLRYLVENFKHSRRPIRHSRTARTAFLLKE